MAEQQTRIVVVGGGRMGLPLACVLAENGAMVTVCDIAASVVQSVNAGQSPYEEPGLDAIIAKVHGAGRLSATNDTTAAVKNADAVIIIVPAHLTDERDIDYHILELASTTVAKGLQKNTLVSYETTVAVGGTRSRLIPVLERESGLKAGRDFLVAFSPERVKANQVLAKLRETPKVVGGFDTASAARAEWLYGTYLVTREKGIINVDTLEAAELSKLADMLYRDVNIALANELAAYAEAVGADFAAVRNAANTCDESNLLLPGIGVGGHCTPVYPYFVIRDGERVNAPQRLATAARQVNDVQAERNVARLAGRVGALLGKRVHILGLAFRPDVKVEIFSTAFQIRDALARRGAATTLEDPWYNAEELASHGFASAQLADGGIDYLILNTAHKEYKTPDVAAWQRAGVRAVLDGRNCWSGEHRRAIEAAGIVYIGVGDGR